jgi:cytochrome c-type biogenesis protein CcmH/NrfF
MKLAHKSLLVAGLIATMGLAANAQPAPPPGAGPMSPMGEHRGDPKMMHEQMQAHMQERMAHRMECMDCRNEAAGQHEAPRAR